MYGVYHFLNNGPLAVVVTRIIRTPLQENSVERNTEPRFRDPVIAPHVAGEALTAGQRAGRALLPIALKRAIDTVG